MSTAIDRPPGDRPQVVAVLGPTNTGKTHLAIERMLGYRTGMIGFPLRLLARENYDKIARLKGPGAVALITGEERILPPAPRWFVCTVEAMPLDREVGFLAVDEIQMMADRDRGHVFTDRLLHARGRNETMFLGAETAKPIIRKLAPGVEFVARPRFSTLSYLGPRKITRLPRRSAMVAFSAAEVYGIADLVRRQRGGAAVVFGALSPRTRNAQVAMYQAGEVDYLVATDAIGMGLNMDIDHVAFAQLRKFDGFSPRRLTDAELGQIAGRAGRHMTDGSFGTTAEIGALESETVSAIEEHRFPALKAVYWRNTDLDFASLAALLASLDARPPLPELVRKREADDHLTLAALAGDAGIADLARGRDAVRLLWEVCQIPDFRKTMSESHVRLVGQIFRHLRGPAGKLPEDWVAAQVARLDRVDGDIDALLARIAHIRTWTYVSHRPAWLADAVHWQERARAVDDRLSDALHDRLTQRFVDRRAAALTRRLNDGDALVAAVTEAGEVLVEGQFAGRLEGFNFVPDRAARDGGRALLAAANKALRRDLGERVRKFSAAEDAEFALDPDGMLRWRDRAIARLTAGEDMLSPRVEPLPADLLEAQHRDAVRRRLVAWLDGHFARMVAPLRALQAAPLTGAARGLAFELSAALGVLPRGRIASQVAALSRLDRRALAGLGVVIGETAAFLPALKNHASVALRALLWSVFHGRREVFASGPRLSLARDPALPPALLAACFFLPAGPLYVRADRLEKFARTVRMLAQRGPFAPTPALAATIGAKPADLAGVLAALGYRAVRETAGVAFVRRTNAPRRRKQPAAPSHSPFAELARLVRP
ncbi:MAG: disulfide oxidoreductase [Rhodospirillales bacterium]|nr:disulfide oxidoreductase [Rhodospirillales bacterium]